MGPSVLAIQFKDDFFEVTKDLKPFIWANLKKLSSPLEIGNLCQGTSKSNTRKFTAIPPFIANTLHLSPPMKAKDVLIHCQVAILSFDNHFKRENSSPKAKEEYRDLIKFVWVAYKSLIPAATYIKSSNKFVRAWSEKLHPELVLPLAPAPAIGLAVTVPSNAKLSNLALLVSLLKESVEK
eukprot:14813773-Ditylum_brightwellii.AAC.2